jgi:hypothetical protein
MAGMRLAKRGSTPRGRGAAHTRLLLRRVVWALQGCTYHAVPPTLGSERVRPLPRLCSADASG